MSRLKTMGLALLVLVLFAPERAAAAGNAPSPFTPANDVTVAEAGPPSTPRLFDELMAKKRLELPGSQLTKARRTCTTTCDLQASRCYEACDLNPPGGRPACYNECFWQQEECYCACGISGYCH